MRYSKTLDTSEQRRKSTRRPGWASAIAFGAALMLHSGGAQAADFTIQAGQTVGPQTLNTPGDRGTINAGGTINSGGSDGVGDVGAVDNLSVFNFGTITSNLDGIQIDGDNAIIRNDGIITSQQDGIEVNGDNSNITNNGTITVTTTNDGIEANNSSGHTITNNGTITVQGNGDGIDVDDNNTVTNTGTINAGDNGIEARNNNTITNSGTINASDEGINANNNNTITNSGTINASDDGINANNNNTITNSGTINSSDDGISANNNNTIVNAGTIVSSTQQGIDADNNSRIVNSGTIISQTNDGILINNGSIVNSGLIQGVTGIDNSNSGGDDLTVTNSGTIIGTGGNAILFRGGSDVLTLQPGSNIQGTINFGGGTDSLNVENGLSIVNTFANGPEVLNTNGAPFARIGNQIAVLDPTLFSVSDEIVTDITNGVHNAIHGRLGRFGRGGFPKTSSVSALGAARMSLGAQSRSASDGTATDQNAGMQGWVHGFGAFRDQDGDGASMDTNHYTGGLVSGADKLISRNTVAGLFIGGSISKVEHRFDGQDEDIDSVFIGAYARTTIANLAFDIMLTGGITSHERERQVANNLAVGGLQTATADYDGQFISPEIAVSYTQRWNRYIAFQPSVRFRYTGLFLDGFAESGAADNLAVTDRDIHQLQGRLQFAFPMQYEFGGRHIRFAPRFGIAMRSMLSDETINATLLGQSIVFDPGGDDRTTSGFVGADLTVRPSDRLTIFGTFEANVDDESHHLVGHVGMRFKF